MAREEDELLRRPGRGRPRHSQSQAQPQRASAKMKMASLMAAAEEDRSDLDSGARGKRKCVKKARDDDWAQPQPQMRPQPRDGKSTMMAPASILNPAPAPPVNVSSRFSIAAEAEAAAADVVPAPMPSGPRGTSLFHELPAVVSSFADAERRRPSNSSSNAPSTKPDTKNAAKHATSVYDLFFPDGRAAEPADAVATNVTARSLKRKRRAGRRGDDMTAELDLLRFGVDSVKLVPQGLVDRVDAQLSQALRTRVVESHVANWCRRAGFAAGFLQELTTLLAAYYPCGYPTLLDEVLAGFLFQRPEFMALLLPAMLDKMLKSGETVSPGKYPLADALVRSCGASGASPRQRDCHELACVTLLRCLVERNRHRFVLSPCVAVCALACSGRVVRHLWRGLLRSMTGEATVATDEEMWEMAEPEQQAVELLAEEERHRSCRLSCSLVELVLQDEPLQQALTASQNFLVAQSLERAMTLASPRWSSAVLSAWLEQQQSVAGRKAVGKAVGKAVEQLVAWFVRLCAQLSMKKTDWFATHVLRFLLSPACRSGEQERILRAVLGGYMPLLLGGTDEHWAAAENGKMQQNGSDGSALDNVEQLTVLEVVTKMELMLGIVADAGAQTYGQFLDVWTELWTLENAPVPWKYVLTLLCVAVEGDVASQKLESLVTQVCRAHFRRLSLSSEDAAAKFSEALSRLLPCARPIASALLIDVVGALAVFAKRQGALGDQVLGNAVMLHLACVDGADISGKLRGGHKALVAQDMLVAQESAVLEASSGDVQVLAALTVLTRMKSETGSFVRRVLSSRALVRVLTSCLATGRRRRQREMLLDVMIAVVSQSEPLELNNDWTRQHVVQELVRCAYTAPSSVSRRATSLLQSISRRSSRGTRALLWVVLQQCTNFCCGCEDKENGNGDGGRATLAKEGLQATAGTFAELVKVMLHAVPTATLHDVLLFASHELSSCSAGGTRMNLFLLLLLQKLVLGELGCDVFLPVVQQAVCPLAGPGLDHVRLVQLQLLKALCSRLITVQQRPSRKTKKRGRDVDWQRCEDLVCSDRLQSDLRAIITTPRVSSRDYNSRKVERSSRASVVLAEGILAFVRQLQREPRSRQDDGGARV